MGAITQKKIFVYADVTYKLNVDFMYQIDASSQDIEFVISRSDASPSLKLTGKTYKSDGTEQNVNNGTQISRYQRSPPSLAAQSQEVLYPVRLATSRATIFCFIPS